MTEITEISVIVPAKNAERTLPALLRSLEAQDVDRSYEVIVVDDGSTDATPALVTAAGGVFSLISAEDSSGAGAARNLGAAAARGRILAFTDADCAPTPTWLSESCRLLDDADLVQGAVAPDPLAAAVSPYDRSLTVTYERGFYETANVCVTRELFDRLGGFEDWLPSLGGRPQGEDTLFGWTARRSGARVVFSSAPLVHHAVIPQSRREWVLDGRRLQVLPSLVKRIPELRTQALYRRWFFGHRTAAFDVALLGVVTAVLLRRSWPSLLAVRYATLVSEEAARLPPAERLGYAMARTAGDVVGFGALARGSWAARTVVI